MMSSISTDEMFDNDLELRIQPCSEAEIRFYITANRCFPAFANLMPLFMGSLQLNDSDHHLCDHDDKMPPEGLGNVPATGGYIKNQLRDGPPQSPLYSVAVVIENYTSRFQKPNICSVRLGKQLWGEGATIAKRESFDRFAAQTTHAELGFGITSMRVYRGDDEHVDWDADGYQVFNREWARYAVNAKNVSEAFGRFIFNRSSGVTGPLGRAVAHEFLRQLEQLRDTLEQVEWRSCSSNLQFVYEGDGESLERAIHENNTLLENLESSDQKGLSKGLSVSDEYDSDDEEEVRIAPIFSLKLTDFSDARWTPGKGPDENIIAGVHSLIRIFEKLKDGDERSEGVRV